MAPKARIAAFFSTELPRGTRILARRPAPWQPAPGSGHVATRGGDDALGLGMGAPQPIDESDAAANLERAGRRVVLMLHPHRRARLFADLRPDILGRRRHLCVDDPCGFVEFIQLKEGHMFSDRCVRQMDTPIARPTLSNVFT